MATSSDEVARELGFLGKTLSNVGKPSYSQTDILASQMGAVSCQCVLPCPKTCVRKHKGGVDSMKLRAQVSGTLQKPIHGKPHSSGVGKKVQAHVPPDPLMQRRAAWLLAAFSYCVLPSVCCRQSSHLRRPKHLRPQHLCSSLPCQDPTPTSHDSHGPCLQRVPWRVRQEQLR